MSHWIGFRLGSGLAHNIILLSLKIAASSLRLPLNIHSQKAEKEGLTPSISALDLTNCKTSPAGHESSKASVWLSWRGMERAPENDSHIGLSYLPGQLCLDSALRNANHLMPMGLSITCTFTVAQSDSVSVSHS